MIIKGRRVIADRKRKDYYEILSEYGKMTCIEAAAKFNISYSGFNCIVCIYELYNNVFVIDVLGNFKVSKAFRRKD